MYINKDEVSITPVLNQVNEKFKGQLTLGSYPDFYNRWVLDRLHKAKCNCTFEIAKNTSVSVTVTDPGFSRRGREPLSGLKKYLWKKLDREGGASLVSPSLNPPMSDVALVSEFA